MRPGLFGLCGLAGLAACMWLGQQAAIRWRICSTPTKAGCHYRGHCRGCALPVQPAGPCNAECHTSLTPTFASPIPVSTGAPGLGEVSSGYDSSNVLNMKVTLTYPTGFDATSERPSYGFW